MYFNFFFGIMIVVFSVILHVIGHNLAILDERFWYSGEEALRILQSLTKAEFSQYKLHCWIDLLCFLPAYAIFLARLSQIRKFLVGIIALMALFDFFETSIELLILSDPSSGVPLASFMSNCTTAKWCSFLVWLPLFIYFYWKDKQSNKNLDKKNIVLNTRL